MLIKLFESKSESILSKINKAGIEEGWMISYAYTTNKEDEGYQLQRDDEANIFEDDEEAMKFVVKKAEDGSSIHKETIKFIKSESPKEYDKICHVVGLKRVNDAVNESTSDADKCCYVRTVTGAEETNSGKMTYAEAKEKFDELVAEKGYEVILDGNYAIDPNSEDSWIEIVTQKDDEYGYLSGYRSNGDFKRDSEFLKRAADFIVNTKNDIKHRAEIVRKSEVVMGFPEPKGSDEEVVKDYMRDTDDAKQQSNESKKSAKKKYRLHVLMDDWRQEASVWKETGKFLAKNPGFDAFEISCGDDNIWIIATNYPDFESISKKLKMGDYAPFLDVVEFDNLDDLKTRIREIYDGSYDTHESSEDIKRLPTVYSQPGPDPFKFKLVERTDKAALYRIDNPVGDIDLWEVIKIRVLPAKTIKPGGVTKLIPKREKLPSSEEFGTFAWSYYEEERARRQYDKLNSN